MDCLLKEIESKHNQQSQINPKTNELNSKLKN